MPPSTYGVSAPAAFSTQHRADDPYIYQVGFGNRFATEALPGVLPEGQNNPQKNKYGLYNEGMTGAPFVAPRAENFNAWFYRVRPSVAHKGFTRLPDNDDLESDFFPLNKKVYISPAQLTWPTFKLPTDNEKVDWVDGLKTIAGGGDPTLREGLAIHIYLANNSMDKKAFGNSDGDMLIMPQQGRLDIQTEFGKMMVRPGELAVIQRGMKFKVILPDGPSRGYVQEIFGSHYTLPELGPLGGHGLANARDFETPVAHFDIDENPWEIVYKIAGQLFVCHQDHTPFDVVAWHGNYVPYKYDMEKFIAIGSISRDHMDPSLYCVLTVKSKQAGVPLTELVAVQKRWDVTTNTFRPPYFHRNVAAEFLGLIFGTFEGLTNNDGLQPGGASLTTNCCPHGVPYEVWKMASEMDLVPMIVQEEVLAIVIESSMMLTVTDYGMNRSRVNHEQEVNYFKANLLDQIDQVNVDLKAAGRPPLVPQ